MRVFEMQHATSTELLSRSKLWQRDVESIKPLELQVFLRIHWSEWRYQQALGEVKTLLETVWNEVIQGRLADLPEIAFFEAPTVRMTSAEFAARLSRISVACRKAVMFLLETNLSLEKVTHLTHDELDSIIDLVSETAHAAAHALPRHPKLRNVFWELSSGGTPRPLHDLNDAVISVSQGAGLNALRSLYQNMVHIDSASDLIEFSAITGLPITTFNTLH